MGKPVYSAHIAMAYRPKSQHRHNPEKGDNKMKKAIAIALVALVAITSVLAGGAKESDPNTIRIGATPDPHAALLNLVVDDLAEQGITLIVREFTDYITPNTALDEGELDANFYQHIPYLESACRFLCKLHPGSH